MTIHVEAWVQRFRTRQEEKATDATFTFVAVEDSGRPRPVLPSGREGVILIDLFGAVGSGMAGTV